MATRPQLEADAVFQRQLRGEAVDLATFSSIVPIVRQWCFRAVLPFGAKVMTGIAHSLVEFQEDAKSLYVTLDRTPEEYVVQRTLRLVDENADFRWDESDSSLHISSSSLPCDSDLLFHLVCCFLDIRLSPRSNSPRERHWSRTYCCDAESSKTASAHLDVFYVGEEREHDNVPRLLVVTRNPVVLHVRSSKGTVFAVPRSSDNLIYALSLLIYDISKFHSSRFRDVSLSDVDLHIDR